MFHLAAIAAKATKFNSVLMKLAESVISFPAT
jgi:hypothetical protein